MLNSRGYKFHSPFAILVRGMCVEEEEDTWGCDEVTLLVLVCLVAIVLSRKMLEVESSLSRVQCLGQKKIYFGR